MHPSKLLCSTTVREGQGSKTKTLTQGQAIHPSCNSIDQNSSPAQRSGKVRVQKQKPSPKVRLFTHHATASIKTPHQHNGQGRSGFKNKNPHPRSLLLPTRPTKTTSAADRSERVLNEIHWSSSSYTT